jgi:HEAT repeat protein
MMKSLEHLQQEREEATITRNIADAESALATHLISIFSQEAASDVRLAATQALAALQQRHPHTRTGTYLHQIKLFFLRVTSDPDVEQRSSS